MMDREAATLAASSYLFQYRPYRSQEGIDRISPDAPAARLAELRESRGLAIRTLLTFPGISRASVNRGV